MTIRRCIIVIAVAVSLGAPALELFDRWDPAAPDTADTESTAVVLALCVGVAFTFAPIVIARVSAALRGQPTQPVQPGESRTAHPVTEALRFSAPRGRPPTLLRV